MTKITIFALLIFQLTNLLAQDTIPFSIGDNNKIYIKARINNSVELNLMYDTGADICAIKKSILDKTVTIKIDGNEENVGVGGTSIVETSSKNVIKIITISKKA